MEKYKIVYRWNVLDEIEEGNTLYGLDRYDGHTFEVDSINVVELFDYLKFAKEDPSRIEFWKEVKEETDNG